MPGLGWTAAEIARVAGLLDGLAARNLGSDSITAWYTGKDGSRSEGQIPVAVHPASACAERELPCSIHHPSDNHMRNWPKMWDAQKKIMYRRCKHKDFHPDFDHLAFMAGRFGHNAAEEQAAHACDGCCERIFL